MVPRVQAALDNQDFATSAAEGTAYDVLVFPAGFVKATAAASSVEAVTLEMIGRAFAEPTLFRLGDGRPDRGWRVCAKPAGARAHEVSLMP